jgi:hypothetical protein
MMSGKTYRIVVINDVDGVKMRGSFSSARLFLKFYYAYQSRLNDGDDIETYSDEKTLGVFARPPFIEDFLKQLADREAVTTP